ncbi:type II toxin-antitoxin system VapC family toxin [Nitratireductor kimnyeongensis]|uniref:Ribonuclease VapC n=1 Tax=Nitratireductor kimnyeongensis TaxID=430679 RepID=A0ABW0TE63_9HYPH|nr:type II toxin-antitoxin system VapC family toxin [Nitratireductor kimnyeongensis]QZZ37194.1 type II toxin-antitoxin system VapC family toxin [Nitratireductor kimnyeongensis]
MAVRCETKFVIDTSALIAVLNGDDDAPMFLQAFLDAEQALISTTTTFEAHYVARHIALIDGTARLNTLLKSVGAETVDFDDRQLSIARRAYAIYGIGTEHKAALNIGDCFAYALARSTNLPLLFKGDDFVHTDIEPAMKPS